MNKVYPSAAAALEGIVNDGDLLAVGGFGLCGIPEALSNHRLLTTRPDDFDRDVVAAWEDPGAVAWWGGRPVDRSPDALVGEWVKLMDGR